MQTVLNLDPFNMMKNTKSSERKLIPITTVYLAMINYSRKLIMLNKEALLNLTPRITGFNDDGTHNAYYHDVCDEFAIRCDDYVILYAHGEEDADNYCGGAYVFGYDPKKEQFFEVHASHCSCHGLEECWDPEYFETVELLHAYLLRMRECCYGSALEFLSFFKENGIEL